MKLYEAFRQSKNAHPLPEKLAGGLWAVRVPGVAFAANRYSFHAREEALLYRKRSIAEHVVRLMGVTDPVQLDIAWSQDARRPEDLFRLVMKGGNNV